MLPPPDQWWSGKVSVKMVVHQFLLADQLLGCHLGDAQTPKKKGAFYKRSPQSYTQMCIALFVSSI